jgi:hypothetical protein
MKKIRGSGKAVAAIAAAAAAVAAVAAAAAVALSIAFVRLNIKGPQH